GRQLGVLDGSGRREDRVLGEGLYRRSRADGLVAAPLHQYLAVVMTMNASTLRHALTDTLARPVAQFVRFVARGAGRSARAAGSAALFAVAVFALVAASAPDAHAERLKDLVSILGVRDNPLIGYGLVVGLDGTGDQTTQTPFTTQTLANML